ncbi:MAG TPA: hypothetical protein VGM03_20990 [Phycisphaerae bacterium]|jgi:hypothetical protein
MKALWHGFATVLLAVAPVLAQTETPARPGDKQALPNPLSTKEQLIRERISRWQDRMYRLQEKLAETEPENAAKLTKAIEQTGELALEKRVDDLVTLLADASRLNLAADEQKALQKDLEAILNVLLEKSARDADRQREIQRLEEIKQELNRLLEEERAQRSDSGKASAAQRRQAAIANALKRIDDLTRRQEEQRAQAQSGSAASKALAEKQAELSRDTKLLADDVRKIGSESETQNPSAQNPPGSQNQQGSPGAPPQPSSPSQGAPSQGSQSQGSQSQKGSQGEQRSGQQSQNGSPSGDNATEKASEDLKSAGEKMDNAKSALEGDKAGQAPAEQEKALEDLRRARHRLEEEAKRAGNKSDLNGMGDKQEETAKKTGALSQKMQQSSKGGQKGDQQGGQQGGESQGDQQPTPGKENVEQAERHMHDAADELHQQKPQEGSQKQDKAIEELQHAQSELEEALKQLRREERDEILRDLEARFREMLNRQMPINKATTELDATGRERFGRPEELRLAELATEQNALGDMAATCLHILTEEGTTIVFPAILEQLAGDMHAVGERLAALSTGSITQAMEQEIVTTLNELIEAVKRMQQENQQQQQGGGGGGDQNSPLLPTSAELKLLRASQLRVNQRTTAIEQARGAGTEAGDALSKSLNQVSHRQREVADIATKIRDRAEQP